MWVIGMRFYCYIKVCQHIPGWKWWACVGPKFARHMPYAAKLNQRVLPNDIY